MVTQMSGTTCWSGSGSPQTKLPSKMWEIIIKTNCSSTHLALNGTLKTQR